MRAEENHGVHLSSVRRAAEEAKLDAEIDALLESDKSELSAPPDSESEEEVNDLLASED